MNRVLLVAGSLGLGALLVGDGSDVVARERVEHIVRDREVNAAFLDTARVRGCVYGSRSADTAYMHVAIEQSFPCGPGAVATYHRHRTGLSDLDVSDSNQLVRYDHPEILVVLQAPNYIGWWSK